MKKVFVGFLIVSILVVPCQICLASDCSEAIGSVLGDGSETALALAGCIASAAGEAPTLGADSPITWLSCGATLGLGTKTVMSIVKAWKDCNKKDEKSNKNTNPPKG